MKPTSLHEHPDLSYGLHQPNRDGDSPNLNSSEFPGAIGAWSLTQGISDSSGTEPFWSKELYHCVVSSEFTLPRSGTLLGKVCCDLDVPWVFMNPGMPISENSLTSKPSIMQVFQGCQCTGIQCFSDGLEFEAVADRFSWTSSNCLVKGELIIYTNITFPSGIRAIQNRHQVTSPHWDSTLNPHLKPRNSNAKIVVCFGRPNTSYHQQFPNFFFWKRAYTL